MRTADKNCQQNIQRNLRTLRTVIDTLKMVGGNVHNRYFGYLLQWCPILILLSGCQVAECGNILMLHPMFAPSHVLALRPLSLDLVAKGHSVTVVRMDPNLPRVRHPNITEHILKIHNVDGKLPHFTKERNARFEMPLKTWDQGSQFNFIALDLKEARVVAAYCKVLLGNESLLKKLTARKYDVVIVDLFFNECSLALAHHLDVPAVGYWPCTYGGFEPMYTMGFNSPLSLIPYIYSQTSSPMTYTDRVWNMFIHIYMTIQMEVTFLITNYHVQSYFPDTPYPSTLLANLSGAIINSHPALDFPRSLPPTFLEIGGFHIPEPKKLPLDIEKFIDGAKEGVVVFSMGASFDTNILPNEVIKRFLNAFARLPQRVIMRVNGKVPYIPDNVMVVHWMPQSDVLAHPSTKLFITHCGMHGAMEAIEHSVPMVGIPIFLDQMDGMLRLKEKNVLVALSKHDDEDTLLDAMNEVLKNKTYTENISRLSRAMRHFSPRPREKAIWLLEHVMQTQGADHLKIRNRFLNTFQYHSLDVLLLYFTVIFCIFAFIYRIVMKLQCRLRFKLKKQ